MDDLSLKLLLNDYTVNLCNRLFVLTLENEKEIKIRFFKESMCHLLGLQHVYDNDRKYLGAKGYEKIKNEEITIQSLKKHNKSQYNFIKNRLFHFNEIIEVLREGDLVKFSQEKVKRGTYITADFVLFKDKQKYLLHLFLIKELNTEIYTPKSFFTLSETDDKNTYIKTNRPLNIIKREEIVLF